MRHVFSIIQWVLTAAVIVFVLVMASSFFPIPGAVKLFSVHSGSMEPSLPLGSLILVKPASPYNPGDIITIRTPNPKVTVTHRIVAETHEDSHAAFITKGDHNEENDTGSVLESDIIGTVRFMVPYMGYPVSFAQTPRGFVLLIILPALLIIFYEIYSIIVTLRARRSPPSSLQAARLAGAPTKRAASISPAAFTFSPPPQSRPDSHLSDQTGSSPVRQSPPPPRRRIV